MKRFDWNTFFEYLYFAIILSGIVIGIGFMIGEIYFTFKTITADDIPFWLKWVLITRGK